MSPRGEQRETFKKYVFFNSQLLKLRKNVELYLPYSPRDQSHIIRPPASDNHRHRWRWRRGCPLRLRLSVSPPPWPMARPEPPSTRDGPNG